MDAVRTGVPPQGRPARTEHESVRACAEVMVARTVAIDEALCACVPRRLVILGAGLDTRAWHLPQLARTDVREIDHPASQQDKKRALLTEAARRRTPHTAHRTPHTASTRRGRAPRRAGSRPRRSRSATRTPSSSTPAPQTTPSTDTSDRARPTCAELREARPADQPAGGEERDPAPGRGLSVPGPSAGKGSTRSWESPPGTGIRHAVTRQVLQLARQPSRRRLERPVTGAGLEAEARANALSDTPAGMGSSATVSRPTKPAGWDLHH
ncbi:class I SAM-dependent methyltransferase [Streptomyces sp. NPDC048641]|uniref:class I SAM-dependent methyltransferase n=1 Tax=Streptomyces sp. NPDC048641 TaxID=3154825 RepID=UPI003420D972